MAHKPHHTQKFEFAFKRKLETSSPEKGTYRLYRHKLDIPPQKILYRHKLDIPPHYCIDFFIITRHLI